MLLLALIPYGGVRLRSGVDSFYPESRKNKGESPRTVEGTQAPTATEIELESVPAELPFCYEEQTYEIQRTTPSTLNVNPGKESSEGKVQLTEEERNGCWMK